MSKHIFTNSQKDTLFAEPRAQVTDFAFDTQVADVFNDMIERSIPGYNDILQGLAELADYFVKDNTCVYDLGCSLGTATLAIRRRLEGRHYEIHAIDNSEAMIQRCRHHLEAYRSATPTFVHQQDIRQLHLGNASMVVMNFTLQFLKPEDRLPLLQRIYAGLNPGGVLILSEKFKFSDAVVDAILIDRHHQFKRRNGYSELEISQKRNAIEHVMKPDDISTHYERLHQVGFAHVQTWYQSLNFGSILAIKANESVK